MHAFTYEYLNRIDFTGKDAAANTVKLMRTEDKLVTDLWGVKPGDKNVVRTRGYNESTSIYESVIVRGRELTVQNVPLHRVLATYWQSREPGDRRSAFLGDSENEFVCMLDGIPFDYVRTL